MAIIDNQVVSISYELKDVASGEPGAEEPVDISLIGRVYTLKKIYSRLVSLKMYLTENSKYKLIPLKNKVEESIELFQLLINNIKSYKDKIDDLIIEYYQFIKNCYEVLNTFLKKEDQKNEVKNNS